MSKGWIVVLSFSVGAATGYFAAKKMLADHYAQLAQEEIDSVKERFREQNKTEPEKSKAEKETVAEKEFQTYNKYAKIYDHTLYSNASVSARQSKPRVISPDEFGEIPEYEKVSLTYYADRVLTDEDNKPMDETDIEMAVGADSLTHFGEYEPDSVYVRNDTLKVDYEILLDEQKYSETLKN